jgi:hypothetical protein
MKSYELGLAFIEQETKKILLTHPSLDHLLLVNGLALFIKRTKGPVRGLQPSLDLDERVYMKTLNTFLNEWDDVFKFTFAAITISIEGIDKPKRKRKT